MDHILDMDGDDIANLGDADDAGTIANFSGGNFRIAGAQSRPGR